MISGNAGEAVAGREKESVQLMCMLEETAKVAQGLVQKIEDRLSPVTKGAPRGLEPVDTLANNKPNPGEWVPLLNCYRAHVKDIRASLKDISDCLDRLEI